MEQKTQEKLLSVIVPMYNSHAYIKKCLDSFRLHENGMERVELIVVDDGSTDGCGKLVEEYIQKYPHKIQLLRKENGGHGSAINAGVASCRGKYIKVVDADDWVLAEGMKRILDILPQLGWADVVVTGYQIYDIEKQCVQTVLPPLDQGYRFFTMDEMVKQWRRYRRLFWLHGMIYRTSFYRQMCKKLPEKVFYEDNFFVAVPCGCAKSICYIPQLFYVYRVGDSSQSVSVRNKVAHLSDLEMVITAMCEAYDAKQDSLWEGAKQFWRLKMAAVLSGYFYTVLLCFENRTEGRRRAKDKIGQIRKTVPAFYEAAKWRYRLLWILGLFHCKEKTYRRLIEYRDGLLRTVIEKRPKNAAQAAERNGDK